MLADGDLISVDCGAILDGWHGDAAVTIPSARWPRPIWRCRPPARRRCAAGIAAALPGGRLSDISHAVQSSIAAAAERDRADYGIVAEYGGHGIGTAMHMDPFLPNHGDPGQGPRLRPGMALAIEPMLTAGDPADRRARGRLDGRHRRRRPRGALGAHGGDHRRRPAGAHPAAD